MANLGLTVQGFSACVACTLKEIWSISAALIMIMYSYNNISHAIDDDLTLYYCLGILIHLRSHTKEIPAKHFNSEHVSMLMLAVS